MFPARRGVTVGFGTASIAGGGGSRSFDGKAMDSVLSSFAAGALVRAVGMVGVVPVAGAAATSVWLRFPMLPARATLSGGVAARRPTVTALPA